MEQNPQDVCLFRCPADMETVELQMEDVPHDMEVDVDVVGNSYDFGFGMNWNEGSAITNRKTSFCQRAISRNPGKA